MGSVSSVDGVGIVAAIVKVEPEATGRRSPVTTAAGGVWGVEEVGLIPNGLVVGVIAMATWWRCGQLASSWCGSGCCLLTERPRRGAKSGVQQQQRGGRGPARS